MANFRVELIHESGVEVKEFDEITYALVSAACAAVEHKEINYPFDCTLNIIDVRRDKMIHSEVLTGFHWKPDEGTCDN